MLRKTLLMLVLIVLVGAAFAPPARAQSQAVSFNLGYLWVRSMQGRYDSGNVTYPGDVLWTEFNGDYYDQLAFRLQDFNNVTFGGEWLVGLGDFLEGGLGVSYYSANVPSISANLVNADTGADILQTLRLRMIPINATVRFLPLGRHAVVEPYIGGGVAIINYRYAEEGDFVDATDPNNLGIFSATYTHSGWAVGPQIVGGLRVPFGAYFFGGEYRYQWARGSLPTTGDNAFLSDRVDLGASTFQVTFGVRF
jgi:hypothetical protein